MFVKLHIQAFNCRLLQKNSIRKKPESAPFFGYTKRFLKKTALFFKKSLTNHYTRAIINIVETGCSSVWLERYLGVVEAVGSSPVTPTNLKKLMNILFVSFFICIYRKK